MPRVFGCLGFVCIIYFGFVILATKLLLLLFLLLLFGLSMVIHDNKKAVIT
jgi:hypothetical protein